MADLIKKSLDDLPLVVDYKKNELTFYGYEITLSNCKLTTSEISHIESINYALVKDVVDDELLELVFVVVSNSLLALNSKMEAADQYWLTSTLKNELENNFCFLSIKEFDLIIRNGIRGKYGTRSLGISIANFYVWAQEYNKIKHKTDFSIRQKILKIGNSANSHKIPIDLTEGGLIEVIRKNYIQLNKEFELLSNRIKIELGFDQYWIENGLSISFNFLFPNLIRIGLITKEQLSIEIDELNRIGLFSGNEMIRERFKSLTEREILHDAQRIVCCKLAISLRNKKLDKDE